MKRLREALLQKYPHLPPEFELLEARFLRNLREGRMYGQDDPGNRAEWARIIGELIRVADEKLGICFNDLCRSEFRLALSPDEQTRTKKDVSPSLNRVPYDGRRKHWAVLVGVSTYKDSSPLPVCAKDVVAIAHQLVLGGFALERMVVLVDDAPDDKLPTRDNILSTLKVVADATQPDDLLLFYYTGHGDENGKESYLVTQSGRTSVLEDTAIPISRVTHILRNASAREKVMILDACHAGAAIGTKGARRMSEAFIRRVFEQAEGIATLSSCKQHQFSYPWPQRERSVYTYYLLEALQGLADRDDKGFVTVADIHRYVTYYVTDWAMQRDCSQNPTISTEMSGEIVVCKYKKEPVIVSPSPATLPSPQMQVPPSDTPWDESATIPAQGKTYVLYKPISTFWTADRGAIWQKARAQQVGTSQLVWLKQVRIVHPTQRANALRETLRQESQLLADLERDQQHDFPRLLFQDSTEWTYTIAHVAFSGQPLSQTFGHTGKSLDKQLIYSLLQSLLPLCRVLGILHRKHLSHRYLTPEEILISRKGQAILQDVGLAAWQYTPGEGPPSYQAPEQLHMTPSIPGPHTDIYQLGTILHFLITGQPPAASSIVPPHTYNEAILPTLDEALVRAIAPRAKDRWRNIHEFSTALNKATKEYCN
jgi:hypothetical protein